MTDLSPATRAVFETFNSKFEWIEDGVPGLQFHAIAAAIRKLADQVVPHPQGQPTCTYMDGYLTAKQNVRAKILAIAAELEGTNDPA